MSGLLEILVQVAVFVGVVAAAMVGSRILEGRLAVRRRLGAEGASGPSAPLVKPNTVASPALAWVQESFLNNAGERDKLRRDLFQAGFTQSDAPARYVALRFSMAIGLPVLFVFLSNAAGTPQGPFTLIAPMLLAGVGLVGPRLFINARATSRRQRIENQFPDALDLMVICVEAGLGIDAAFQRVGVEVANSHPEISRELAMLSEELGAGRGRSDALKSMAERLDVDSIRAFVALLIQTDALGVSIAQGLRTYSAEMRETRFLKAEEKAMRIPVLMTVPLVACFMPVIVVVLLLPPAIDMVRNLLPALRGGG